jgi:signal transduction histidine kinase
MKKYQSLRIKLIQLFLIMGLIPSVVVMSILYWGVSQHLENQIGGHLQTLALETSLRVDMFIQNKIQSALKYSEYSTLKRIYFPNQHEKLTSEFMASLFKFDSDLYNITLLDNARIPLFSHQPNALSLASSDPWWEKACTLAPSEVLLINHVGKKKEECTLDLVIPILSDVNQKRLGVMVTTFHLETLLKLIENIPISGDYYIALTEQEGHILANTKKETGKVLSPGMRTLLHGKPAGWALGRDDISNTEAVFGFAPVMEFAKHALQNQRLEVYVSQKKNSAFAPIVTLLWKLLGLCLLVVLGILLIFAFRIEAIWKPILSLKKGVEKIGSGNFDLTLFINTRDELEDLANAFNTMGKNLKNSRETLEEQNRKLIELNQVKNNFLSMVSHELRTPLMIIKEALSQLLDEYKGPIPEEQKEFLNMAFRNAGRLNQIIENLLNISKIETGKMKFYRYPMDLVNLLKVEMANQKIKSDEKNIRVFGDFDREIFKVYADKEKIQMIFTNLLGNAIKFTHKDGEIHVGIQGSEDSVKVSVRDTGPGIPAYAMEKIFERFVRLNPTPLVGAPSTGLGLAIARELAEMHQGKIWAESDGKSGSTFHWTLPCFRGPAYLKIYWDDRIREALEREIDMSVIGMHLHCFEKPQEKMKRNQVKSIFSELCTISLKNIFEPLEVIPLEDSLEIFIFTFADDQSASIITNRLRHLFQDYLNSTPHREDWFVSVAHVSLHAHGDTTEDMMRALNERTRTSPSQTQKIQA